jgi:hypothetical protein
MLKPIASGARWSGIRHRPILLESVEFKTVNLTRLSGCGHGRNIGDPIPAISCQSGGVSNRKCNNVYSQLNVDAHPASPIVPRFLPSLLSRHFLRFNIHDRCRVSGKNGDRQQSSRSCRFCRPENPQSPVEWPNAPGPLTRFRAIRNRRTIVSTQPRHLA